MTFDGTTTRMYIDGAAVAVSEIGVWHNHGDWCGFSAPVTAAIGARLAGNARERGVVWPLDEVTLYQPALTPAEIASIAMAGTAGKCNGAGGALTCTDGAKRARRTIAEADGQCNGAGSCEPDGTAQREPNGRPADV